MHPARLESSQSFPALSQHWTGTDHQKWWQLGKNKIIINVFKKLLNYQSLHLTPKKSLLLKLSIFVVHRTIKWSVIYTFTLIKATALQPTATCPNRHIFGQYRQRLSQLLSIIVSFSLWHHLLIRPDYPRGSRLWRSQPTTKPAILIMMSFATELATPSVTDVRMHGHLTAFNI